MLDDIITLDIETENTGYDIMEDNKRIISIQLLDGKTTKIYYDGSENNNLTVAKQDVLSMIENNKNFLGFNIRGFDIKFIKKFLGIEIPDSQIIEISEMASMDKIRGRLNKKRPRLVEVCNLLQIDCSHKMLMNERSSKFKILPDVIEKAKEGASKWRDVKGWDYDFSYNLALDIIGGGMAILEAFNEFVEAKGDPNSLFYQYAMGDVFTEKEVYLKLK